MRCAIVQYTTQHAECIGLAVEYLIHKYNVKQIDILLCEKDTLGKEWFEFFERNFNVISFNRIVNIVGFYNVVFFLTSSDYILEKPSIKGDIVGLAHQNIKRINDGIFKNLCICPFISCAKIPFTFRYLLSSNGQDAFFPEIKFFITGWHEHLNLCDLNLLFVKLGLKCLYISKRNDSHTKYSNLLLCPHVETAFIINCFLYKTCIFLPKENSTYYSERISGCIHLSASFGTRLLLPHKLKEIYNMHKNFISYGEIFDYLNIIQ